MLQNAKVAIYYDRVYQYKTAQMHYAEVIRAIEEILNDLSRIEDIVKFTFKLRFYRNRHAEITFYLAMKASQAVFNAKMEKVRRKSR